MDESVNATLITLGGHVDLHRLRYLYFVLMFSVYLLILGSNSTIVSLIWIHQSLHQPMYVFIAALLVNSVLYSCVLYPKLLLDFLSEEQLVSYSVCLLQCFLYYSLNGSEFLLLAAMSYDRFLSICRPLRYAATMGRSRVATLLLLSWLLPACQVAVPVALSADASLCRFRLRGVICNNTIYGLHCHASRALALYGAVALVNLSLLPLLFILFTYGRILKVALRGDRQLRLKAANTCLPHLLVLINFSCLFTYDVVVVKLESEVTEALRLALTLQVILYHPLFNPMVYGLKMKEISKRIRALLCRKKTS
ncbi:uncharacterized protein V6R79_003778 [Siganus canaliculatus]